MKILPRPVSPLKYNVKKKKNHHYPFAITFGIFITDNEISRKISYALRHDISELFSRHRKMFYARLFRLYC